jgi:hypothetical protein
MTMLLTNAVHVLSGSRAGYRLQTRPYSACTQARHASFAPVCLMSTTAQATEIIVLKVSEASWLHSIPAKSTGRRTPVHRGGHPPRRSTGTKENQIEKLTDPLNPERKYTLQP